MYQDSSIAVVIPARNESQVIASVVRGLRALKNEQDSSLIDRIIVCDNGSTDGTGEVARSAGAEVVRETRPGYGAACLRALEEIDDCDIIVFVDGDGSVVPQELIPLIAGVVDGAHLAIGSRFKGSIEPGAMTFSQALGTRLVSRLVQWLWNHPIADLGPTRAIRAHALRMLDMADTAYGWTVEMHIRAIQQDLRIVELPVTTRRRIGKSKISGTLRGVIGAGCGMLGTVSKLWLEEHFGWVVEDDLLVGQLHHPTVKSSSR